MKSDVPSKTNESSSIFDGGKARIAEILERELQRLKKDVERESAKIIAEARERAQVIINQAESKAKQELKEKIKYETQNLLAVAEGDAQRIATEARQNAQQKSDKIIADARQEAEIQAKKVIEEAIKASEGLTRSATETKQRAEEEFEALRESSKQEASGIIKKAREVAETKVLEEEKRILSEAMQRGKVIIEEARASAITMFEQSIATTGEMIQRLNQCLKDISDRSVETQKCILEIEPQKRGVVDIPLSHISPKSQMEAPVISNEQAELFTGEIELEVDQDADPTELSEWTNALRNIPLLRVLSNKYSSSGQARGFLIVCSQPNPLIETIYKMPMVKNVKKEDNKLLVSLL
jgi:cell division septum initiation protein DivIVA